MDRDTLLALAKRVNGLTKGDNAVDVQVEIALMPIAVEPEFATPLRTACFALVGVTVFACLFGAFLS